MCGYVVACSDDALASLIKWRSTRQSDSWLCWWPRQTESKMKEKQSHDGASGMKMKNNNNNERGCWLAAVVAIGVVTVAAICCISTVVAIQELENWNFGERGIVVGLSTVTVLVACPPKKMVARTVRGTPLRHIELWQRRLKLGEWLLKKVMRSRIAEQSEQVDG